MFNHVVSTVPADGLAPLGARPFAGIVRTINCEPFRSGVNLSIGKWGKQVSILVPKTYAQTGVVTLVDITWTAILVLYPYIQLKTAWSRHLATKN